ncbi:hypothetical protein [Saccharothrix lopnurensis]|uniref:Uncharacterized protein n=1 Tax=Saccharothrix lopnurensis TaxID=1670621 RepID=A0ABW1PGV9_9PSEU
MPSHRHRISLIVVAATGDEVTGTVHDTEAADRHHNVGSMRPNTTLTEFLCRHDESTIPDGIPIVRFDTTDEAVSSTFRTRGPSHLEYPTPGVMQHPDGIPVPYDRRAWHQLTGFPIADDVYALLADQAGMRVARTTRHA